jgi:hypothetical protein
VFCIAALLVIVLATDTVIEKKAQGGSNYRWMGLGLVLVVSSNWAGYTSLC